MEQKIGEQQIGGGRRLKLSLKGWGALGEALASHDGREVHVFGGIPGEEVMAEVIKERRDYLGALVVEVIGPSVHRTSPPCPYFGPCTGCQWQHVSYQHQLQMKRQIVADALSRVGNFREPPVLPTMASPQELGYRNHARFTVGRRKGELGFVNRVSRRFVFINECLLMHPFINDAVGQLQGRCAETSQLSIRYGVNSGDFLIQPSLKSPEVPLVSGQKHYEESLGGSRFKISASSFFQVNTRQAEAMVELVREGLELSGQELLVDAYAGVGTFAIMLAPFAGRVIAIEESSSAVKDAVINADGVENVQFIEGKTEDVLAGMPEQPHGVILDPPRAGCHRGVLEALGNLAPHKLVYVSCDPETLSRDLNILCLVGFRLERVQPIDMFPQTHHIECVATLSWRGTGPAIGASQESAEKTKVTDLVLASTSPRRRELLGHLGLKFRVAPPSGEEDLHGHGTPRELVERLALKKAKSILEPPAGALVLGGDSVVVLDGKVLGKPATHGQAREMLEGLRGVGHQVVTGVALVDTATGRERTASQVTMVTMRDYTDQEIEGYVASGEPMDKAGAYAVQDPSFRPAASLEGCYTNVMGLPLCLVADMLVEAGVSLRPESGPKSGIEVLDECTECPLRDPSRLGKR